MNGVAEKNRNEKSFINDNSITIILGATFYNSSSSLWFVVVDHASTWRKWKKKTIITKQRQIDKTSMNSTYFSLIISTEKKRIDLIGGCACIWTHLNAFELNSIDFHIRIWDSNSCWLGTVTNNIPTKYSKCFIPLALPRFAARHRFFLIHTKWLNVHETISHWKNIQMVVKTNTEEKKQQQHNRSKKIRW